MSRRFVSLLLAALLFIASVANAGVVELNPSNYKSIVEDRSKNVFVLFYAPWCGHCNQMKPIWETLGDDFPIEGDVIIAKVDASMHRDISKANGISGFPTMKFFSKSNKAGIEYEGPRQLEAWKSYIKSQRK